MELWSEEAGNSVFFPNFCLLRYFSIMRSEPVRHFEFLSRPRGPYFGLSGSRSTKISSYDFLGSF